MIYECNVFRSRILYAVILVFCLTFVRHLISCNFSSYGGGLQVRLTEEGVQGKYLTLLETCNGILIYTENRNQLLILLNSLINWLLFSVVHNFKNDNSFPDELSFFISFVPIFVVFYYQCRLRHLRRLFLTFMVLNRSLSAFFTSRLCRMK